ncbi:MAG: Smr/MutS family protein [Gemmatimonadetes bacterium]|nr:Smr/MutS family protein [Gemmatimonadota bacterium]
MFLDRWARTRPGAVVRIVTGRGNHSEGAPVLYPMVAQLLGGRLAHYVRTSRPDSSFGAYLVQVK